MVKVLLFAALREAAGVASADFEAADVGSLLDLAIARFGPEFEKVLGFAQVAVNGTLISHLDGLRTRVGPSDEVALLPPVSGGAISNFAV